MGAKARRRHLHADEPYPLVGIACLISREGKYLLLRRRGPHGHGTWCPPGGHLEHGETPEACAVREAAEESGLRVCNVRFVGVTSDLFEESGKHYITLWMAADAPDGDPHIAAPDEMDAIGWFGLESLPSPLFTSLDNMLTRPVYRSPDALPSLPGRSHAHPHTRPQSSRDA